MGLLGFLFILGVVMIIAGFLARVGADGLDQISENTAASLALLVVFGILVGSVASSSELAKAFEAMCGGIPFANELADYGSLKNVFSSSPLDAAIAFLDTVLLAVMIELIATLPWSRGNARGKLMVNVLTAVVVALLCLLFLNFVVKSSSVYQWIASVIAALISLVSIGTIPAAIASLFQTTAARGGGILALFIIFSQGRLAGALRAGFVKAVIYVAAIFILENRFGNIANGMSFISTLVVAFLPVVIVCMGLYFILRSARL